MFRDPGVPYVPQRAPLTPGRLYAMMSLDFREARSRQCSGCIMPLLSFRQQEREGEPNWALEPLGMRCGNCEASAARIFAKYAAIYDVKDHSLTR